MLDTHMLWLAAFGLGLLLLAAALIHLTSRSSTPRWMYAIWTSCAVALIGLTGADLVLPFYRPSENSAWVPLTLVVLQIVLIGLCIGLASNAFRQFAIVSILILATGSTVQASRRFYELTAPPADDLSLMTGQYHEFSESDFAETVEARAVTDRGSRIPVFTVADPEITTDAIDPSVIEIFSKRIMEVAPADPNSNCHGYAFTGGKYAVRGRDVPQILDENGYNQVALPIAGDLIIYRSGGECVHTGIVKAVGPNFVLIESKWGVLGVFLHAPADQCYGDEFAYYRSQRPNHLLIGIEAPSIDQVALPDVAPPADPADVDVLAGLDAPD